MLFMESVVLYLKLRMAYLNISKRTFSKQIFKLNFVINIFKSLVIPIKKPTFA